MPGMVDDRDDDDRDSGTGDPEFGKRLTKLREDAGLTQEQLAQKLGATSGNVSRWERGVAYPRAAQLKSLASFFGVSTDHLLFGSAGAPFQETPDWLEFLESTYGELARQRGWIDDLKRIRLPVPMTAQVYSNLVHAMLSVVRT